MRVLEDIMGRGQRLGLGLLAASIFAVGAARADVNVAQYTVDITVRADGTYVELVHIEQSATNATQAAQLGQFPIGFTPTLENIDIVEAYTQKSGGVRKPVDAAAIKAQLAPGVPSVPMFSDIQQKVVIFPDVGPNDVTVLTYRRTVTQPLFSGHFTRYFVFAGNIAWRDARVTITAPETYPLQTESIGTAVEKSSANGQTSYTWTYRAIARAETFGFDPIDRRPRIFVSSFQNYDAMAAAYVALNRPKEALTPKLQAKADEITAGLATHAAQAKALYEWVSKNIRYVALFLDRGGVEPHQADDVLANGYGDCKDHVVLLAALLRAKGIDSRGVLINLGNAYLLSTPPTLAQLNHVITYIPELDVYADSTAGVAPFGVLPPSEYGKPAVMSGAGVALIRMPLTDGASNVARSFTDVTLDSAGHLMGTTSTDATGPFTVNLRLIAKAIQQAGSKTLAERQLTSLGQSGTGSFTFTTPTPGGDIFKVYGNFILDDRPGILDGEGFTPPLGLMLFVRPGNYLLGPMQLLSLPDSEPTMCFAGTQVETLSLHVPKGRKPAKLPPDRQIQDESFTYTSHWSFEDETLTVRRELISRIRQPTCDGPLRAATAAALKTIRREQQTTVALAVD